jgi:hypothetical protein
MRKEALLSILLGLGVSAFFWFPALTEMRYTNVASQVSATSDYHDHFVCIGQLWNSVWGYGGSAKGCLDGFAFKIGKLHLILGLIALLGVFMKRRYVVIAGLAVFLLSVFFMLPVSRPVWETLPLFAYVQYPWRFLAFAIFGISLMGAGITVLISNRYLRWAAVFVSIGVLLFIEAKHFTPQYIYDRNPSDFETAEDLRWRVSKISDEYLPGAVTRPTESSQYIRDTIPGSDGYTVQTVENRNTYKKFEFRSGWDNEVTVNVADFPGWRYMVNEFTVRPQLSNGLPRLTVPSGLTVVQMWFTDTPVRTAGNIVSLASVAVCLYIYDRKNKKNIS